MTARIGLSQAQCEFARNLAAIGVTLRDIAEVLGVSPSTAHNAVNGSVSTRVCVDEQDVFTALACYQDHTTSETADLLGVSDVVVARIWSLATRLSQKVWSERRAEIQDEWTRRGAPEWRVRG